MSASDAPSTDAPGSDSVATADEDEETDSLTTVSPTTDASGIKMQVKKQMILLPRSPQLTPQLLTPQVTKQMLLLQVPPQVITTDASVIDEEDPETNASTTDAPKMMPAQLMLKYRRGRSRNKYYSY